jgi:hypothetical protein
MSEGPHAPNQAPKRALYKRAWDWLSKGWNFIKAAKVLFTVAQFFFVGFVPLALTTSFTLKSFIYVFAILAAFAANLRTKAAWKGEGVDKRMRQANWFVWCGVLALLFDGALISILDPNVASRYPWAGAVQDELVDFPVITNTVIALSYAIATYCLVGFFTIVSPDMKRGYQKVG